MSIEEQIAENITRIRAHIVEAAERGGRDPSEITLVAVSKTRPVEMIEMAYAAGVKDFGENRVQEAEGKIAAFRPEGVRWHMIGHLQSNKAQKVARLFDTVHSIDSLHLAQTLNRIVEQTQRKRLPILLEVNVAGETSKAGIAIAETLPLARQLAELQGIELKGLMTVAPLVEEPEEVRPVFRELRQLRDQIREEFPHCEWLSMGMTDDYAVAIEEGATIIRIGRAIFGERDYKGATT